MKASLFFAEIQSAHYGLTENIKNSSEENRATLAEYVNKSIDKKNRPRDYTADDIANDTDGIATQLGIMQFASPTFINYADAISSLEADQAQESAIGDVVGEMQQESAEAVEGEQSAVSADVTDGVSALQEAKYSIKKDSSGNNYVDVDESIVSNNDSPKQIVKTLADMVRTKFTDFINVKGQKIGINAKTAKEWVYSNDAVKLNNMDSAAFIDKVNAFGNANELLQVAKNYVGEAKKHQRQDAFVEFARGVVDFKVGNNGYSADIIVGTTKSGTAVLYDVVNIQGKKIVDSEARTAQDRRSTSKSTTDSIHQNKPTVKSKSKKNSKRDLASNPSQKSEEKADKTVESKTEGKSAERKNEADKPVIRKPKEALTDKQRVERAVKRAEKLIEWENKTQPTTKELNTAREYIKDFDSLPPSMRTSVFKMLRSADGKVDKNTLKGVANLMTMRRRDGRLVMPDLELRFAEGIVDGGLYTHIGEGENRRVLILINSDADFKETVKGTIAHEVVHYIENRKGYRELADYVLKTAKKEKIAEIEGEYNEHYKGIYTAESEEAGLTGDAVTKKVAERMATKEHGALIESEVVAKLIGLRLNNEKFLKKYATKDDAMIKKIFRFLRASVSYLKDKDKATADEMTKLVLKFDEVIKGNVTSESEGTKTAKYSFAGKKAETADKLKLATAQEMLANGVDSETVRKETGWFKGYDGEWRFEIDDSDMEYSRNGFNPDYLRYKEIELKFLEGTISDSELQELRNTPQDIKDINLHRLDQFVKHKALFEAYPELKRVRVSFDSSMKENGTFYPLLFSIKINPKAEDVRKTLLHEIQHAVQYTEGFTEGADVKEVSPELKNRLYILKEEQKKVSQELEAIYKEIGFDKYSESLWEKAWNMEIDPDTIESLEEQFLAEKSRKGLALYNYQKQVIEMVKETMREEQTAEREAYEQYRNTAGEIEARDVANRADMTAEERKNTRPDVDREDVVFVEGSDLYNSIGITTNNRLVVVVNDDITKGLKNDTEIKNAVKVAIRRFKKVPINKQSIYFISDTANEYTSSKYTTWIEHNDRTAFLDKMRVGQHPQDIIYATTNYINEGLNHPRKDNIIDFARGKILIDVSGNQYDAEVVIGFTKKGICELHDIVKMTPTSFRYKENAMSEGMSSLTEPPRSDMTSSNNSIPQKSDLSTGSAKKNVTPTNLEKMQVIGKRDLAPKKSNPLKTKPEHEANRGNDVYFERAVAESYKKEAESAKRSNEAYKEGNKRLNKKLNESRSKTAKLKSENRSLAQQIARDAYETDAKTFTQKEIDALVERINQYSTDKFKDIMDEKKATISKIDKEDVFLVGFNFILRPRQT